MSRIFYTNLINPNVEYNQPPNPNVTNPLEESLDAGENSIINLPAPSTAGEPVTLAYFNAHLPNTDDFISNPLQENLDADGHAINNVMEILLQNSNDASTGVSFGNAYYNTVTLDGSLNLTASGSTLTCSATRTQTLTINGTDNPSTNYSIKMYGGSLYSEVENAGNGRFYLSSQSCNLSNNPITGVQNVQFYNAGTLDCDSSDNLTYNNDVVITSENIASYVNQHDWTPTASSDLDMANYSVKNMKSLQFNGNTQSIVNLDSNDNLLYNNNLVVVRQPDILASESRTFVKYIDFPVPLPAPGAPIGGNVLQSINLSDPCYNNENGNESCYNFTFTFSNDPVIAFDETFWIQVGFCDNQNYSNSTKISTYFQINSPLIYNTNNTYTCNVSINDKMSDGDVIIENTMDQIRTEFGSVNNAYYFILMTASVVGTGNPAYLNNFSGSVSIPANTYTNDYYISVKQPSIPTYLVELNENSNQYNTTSLSLCQTVSNVPQVDGFNNIMTVLIPPQTGQNGCNVFITATVVSVWYTIKYCCVLNISEAGYIIDTNSLNMIHSYNPNNVLLNANFTIDGDNQIIVQNQIATSSQHNINNASCKVKLLVVNY